MITSCCRRQLDNEIERVIETHENHVHPSAPSMIFNVTVNNSPASTPEAERRLTRQNASSSLSTMVPDSLHP